MYTRKIAASLFTAVIILTGCVGNSNVASRQEVESLKMELAEIKADKQSAQQQFIEQNQEISNILEELASISTKTTNLRIDVENGSAKMTQAEQIYARIDALKKRLASLDDQKSYLSKQNAEMKKVIEGLNKVIKEQESQISTLKKEIEAQQSTITSQKKTIDTQYRKIEQQKEALQISVEKLAYNLYEAGTVLEGIADNAPQVSWKRNKQKVADMQKDIYEKALKYYQKAYDAGYEPAKEKVDSLTAALQTSNSK